MTDFKFSEWLIGYLFLYTVRFYASHLIRTTRYRPSSQKDIMLRQLHFRSPLRTGAVRHQKHSVFHWRKQASKEEHFSHFSIHLSVPNVTHLDNETRPDSVVLFIVSSLGLFWPRPVSNGLLYRTGTPAGQVLQSHPASLCNRDTGFLFLLARCSSGMLKCRVGPFILHVFHCWKTKMLHIVPACCKKNK